jgi:uncharacterized repeat protein (TIGR01451 family)
MKRIGAAGCCPASKAQRDSGHLRTAWSLTGAHSNTRTGGAGRTPAPHPRRSARRTLLGSMLAAACCVGLMLPLQAAGAVWTDQSDYAPGSIVTIAGDNSDGAGYIAGESVVVNVQGPGNYEASCTAGVGGSGSWSCQVTLASDASAVGSYAYTATGQTSGVSQGGSFTDANGCPNLASHTNEDPKLAASYTTSGGEATYSISTSNQSPSGGIPGLIEYCVYTSPLPDSSSASYSDWTTGSGGGAFEFKRSGGNPDNLPFDGSTQTLGTATWTSGTVPAVQTILLHINDKAECTLLEGTNTETCFVRPGAAQPSYTIEKQQRLKGEAGYTTSELSGEVGQTVEYKIIVKNTGTTSIKFSKLTDAKCEGISPSGEVEVAGGGEQDYTCSHVLTTTGKYGNTGTITGAGKTETSNEVVVNVVTKACTGSETVVGIGHYGPRSPGGENLDNNLNTCLTGFKEELQYTWQNKEMHLGLKHLNKATCTVTGTEKQFSGQGLANVNGVKGYEITFTFTIKNGKTYFRMVLEKGGVIIHEFIDEPLTVSKEKISC